MSSGFNPYAPPTAASYVATPETTGENVVTCTFLMTAGVLAQGLALSGKGRRLIVVVYLALIAFSSALPFGLIVQIASVVAVGAAAWFLSPWLLFFTAASRSLANKSDGERTLTWRFSPEGYELTTSASLARGEWWTLHPMKLSALGLWALLILMFLAIWQFLQSDVRPPLGVPPQ